MSRLGGAATRAIGARRAQALESTTVLSMNFAVKGTILMGGLVLPVTPTVENARMFPPDVRVVEIAPSIYSPRNVSVLLVSIKRKVTVLLVILYVLHAAKIVQTVQAVRVLEALNLEPVNAQTIVSNIGDFQQRKTKELYSYRKYSHVDESYSNLIYKILYIIDGKSRMCACRLPNSKRTYLSSMNPPNNSTCSIKPL